MWIVNVLVCYADRFLFHFNLFNRMNKKKRKRVGKNTKWHENKRTIIVVYIYIIQFVCVSAWVYVNVCMWMSIVWIFMGIYRHLLYCECECVLDLHTQVKKIVYFFLLVDLVFCVFFSFHFISILFNFDSNDSVVIEWKQHFVLWFPNPSPPPLLLCTSHSLARPLCLLYTAWIGMLNAWLHFILAVILFILSLVLMFTNFKHIHLFLVNIHKYKNTHTRTHKHNNHTDAHFFYFLKGKKGK